MNIGKFELKIAGLLLFTMMCASAATSKQANGLDVARISLCDGEVTIQRGNHSDWLEASINTPLVSGDTVATWRSARTEIQLDSRNIFRVGKDSQVLLNELSDQQFHLTLERGILTYNKLGDDRIKTDIETPFAVIRPTTYGMFRIEVGFDGKTIITSHQGEAHIVADMKTTNLRQGKTMIVRIVANEEIKSELAQTPPKDDWDRWNEEREKRLRVSHSRQYISQDIYGIEDLDRYGKWRYTTGYGHSWYPNVNTSWSPYRHGRWIWLDHYGWSWVGREPWGWAPYHYGRWHYHKHRGWGWNPGRIYRRHYWRPALVVFFGHNNPRLFSTNSGFGSIGWIPLAPREPYYAWHSSRRSRHHGTRRRRYRNRTRHGRGNQVITVDNSTNIYNTYRNARTHNGATMVATRNFTRGQTRDARSPHHEELRRSQLLHGQIPVIPKYGSRGRRTRLIDSHTHASRRWKTHRKPITSSDIRREPDRRTTLPVKRQRPQTVRPPHTPRSTRRSVLLPGNMQRANRSRTQTRPKQRSSTRQHFPRSQSSRISHRVGRDTVRPSYAPRPTRRSARLPGNVQRANRSRTQRRR